MNGNTRAFVGNGSGGTTNAGSLNVTATATPDAHATANIVNISAIGGIGASPVASVGGTTEVYIGFNATVDLGSGAATLTATRTATATTEALRIQVSLIEVAIFDLESTTAGTIAAHIDDRANVTAGSVTPLGGRHEHADDELDRSRDQARRRRRRVDERHRHDERQRVHRPRRGQPGRQLAGSRRA